MVVGWVYQLRRVQLAVGVTIIALAPFVIQGIPAFAEGAVTHVLHDRDLDGVPDEFSSSQTSLDGALSCFTGDTECALAVVVAAVGDKDQIRIRARKKCPTRKVVQRMTREGKEVRQQLVATAKEKCKRPTKKPTPKPKKTATPPPRGIAPGPVPNPTRTSVPAPTKTATATPTRSSAGGNAAVGKSFYTQVCTSCHGVQGGKSEQQVLSAMSSISDHSSVKTLVTAQTARDIAAYLATVR